VAKREARVVRRIVSQVLDALKRLHSAGIVHRDVKPANLVLMGNRFRLIDFGAATDLRTGINYDPELSLLDPGYCPPEQYVMPGG
jgi:serine/threonine protein kinase